jgi:hypothetical protein
MNPDGTSNPSSFRDIGREQMELAKQLMQVVATARHVDELFQWVASAFVQHFNIQLVQFWSNQVNLQGQLAPQLRTIAHRDPSLPEQVAANVQMASLVQYIMNARRSYRAQAVESLFPSFQTILLKRYGLYYCGACFTSRNVYLPPVERMFAYDQLPTPLTMVALFFVRQVSQVELLAAVNMTLEQALTLAESSSLLTNTGYGGNMQMPGYAPNMQTPPPPQMPLSGHTPNMQQTPQPPMPGYTPIMQTPLPLSGYTPNMQQTPLPPPAPVPDVVLPLEQLVPRRKQDADLMLSSNPFANKAAIADKKARRVHGAIDGQTNIAGLCATTGMSMKEVHIALQVLLNQQHIEIYEPGGRLVKNFPFLRDM